MPALPRGYRPRGAAAAARTHGFLYNGGIYTPLNAPSASNTNALGINTNGQVVGDYSVTGLATFGFLYNGTSYTTLNDPFATGRTSAYGINSSVQVVGFYETGSGVRIPHGFIYSNGTYTTFDDPSGVDGTFLRGIT
jgi:probable HAF family extracellular repeat protein